MGNDLQDPAKANQDEFIYLFIKMEMVNYTNYCVTESSEENLDSNLTSLRWSHSNVLDDQWFVGFPGHRSYMITKKKNV
jgi:hypothetical protein